MPRTGPSQLELHTASRAALAGGAVSVQFCLLSFERTDPPSGVADVLAFVFIASVWVGFVVALFSLLKQIDTRCTLSECSFSLGSG